MISRSGLRLLRAARAFGRSAVAAVGATFGLGRPARWEIIADFVDRNARGERVEQEDYLSRYPRHAKFLRKFFRRWDLIDSLRDRPRPARSLRDNGKQRWSGGPSIGSIDEILAEIVRRVARGEHLAPDVYLARFPEHADALRAFFGYFDEARALAAAPHQPRTDRFAEALWLLPERDRGIIRMVHMEGRAMDVVAAEMGYSREAAGRRLARALHRLRAKLAHGDDGHVR